MNEDSGRKIAVSWGFISYDAQEERNYSDLGYFFPIIVKNPA